MQNSLKLKNSFIFAPIKTGYSDGTGMISPSHIHFYEQRSQHLGAMIIEPLYLHRNLREIPTQIGIDHEDKIPRLQELTALLHSHGTKVIAHLNHPGRMVNPKIPENRFISSTAKPCPNGGAIPTSMDQASMKEVHKLFVGAAVRAEKAGFDMLEVQFGHGYLLAQFLSPDVNDRSDEYGGSFENRIRFPLEILSSIKNSISIPIIARISGDEMIPTGFHVDEMIHFAEILQTQGVAAIHVSAGTVCSTPPWYFQHMFIPKGKTWKFAQQIQENIEIPVIYVGRVNSPKDVEELESQYHAQYIAIGRGLVADPLLVGKFLGKETEPIVPCLACMEGCLGGVKSGQGLQCLVNPSVQKTPVIPPEQLIKVSHPKALAIVGGGLAGMEAAIILAQRGHKVEIFEKDRLGGQFQYASLTPHKRSLSALIPSFVQRIKALPITIHMKEITESSELSGYDGVILATGSKPKIPNIPGLTEYQWAEILDPENLPENETVVIIGGGLIGVDIATALIERNNHVIIMKRTENFGGKMEMIAKKMSLQFMQAKKVEFSDHTHIKNIEKRQGKYILHANRDEKELIYENIDRIVISTGLEPYNPLEKILPATSSIYVIGDAAQIGDAQDAIAAGFDLGMKL